MKVSCGNAVCIVVCLIQTMLFAETYYPEASNRVKINLGETPWKFIKSDPSNAQTATYNDAAWSNVGIPHTWNENDVFINASAGGPGNGMDGICWYRKHFTLDNSYQGRKVFVEFEASHIGMQVYINGTLIKGNSRVNVNATHVIGFLPVIVDLSNYVTFGATDNVLAVRVASNASFFSSPTFSYDFRFGQGCYGLWRPVWMHITDKVYVPANVYSVVNNWGTYVATESVSADASSAKVRVQTHVQNESGAPQQVTLTLKIVDATKNVVYSSDNVQTIPADSATVFDVSAGISNPKLWFPANSIYGKPNMYKVYHIVKVAGKTVDVFESPLGIRTITWDKDYPYINGKQHYMWGASSRYDYPALATAVPEEQQWRDAKILAAAGGNFWRPGHSPSSPEFVAACDAYGIMLAQPSGELEGNFMASQINTPDSIYKRALKSEVHRDMIVRDRNNPSILTWEADNGPMERTFLQYLQHVDSVWDPVNTRAISDRSNGDASALGLDNILYSCSGIGCEAGLHANPGQAGSKPAWGAEGWSYTNRSSRFAYDYELAFASQYTQEWKKARRANCFGYAQWYFCETPGEVGTFMEPGAGISRSFGTSMMDFNRIPKMLYYIWRACWTPFAVSPNVAIAHHWNRAGTARVNVFSNCPSVQLLVNGKNLGAKVPNGWNTTNDEEGNQATTSLSQQCWWDVPWESGTLRAEGLDATGKVVCFDEKKTAGSPNRIELTVEPALVKPSGDTFNILANGTDAAFILAKVVDANGILCPVTNNVINFAVSGPGNYRGGSDQFVGTGGSNWHAPGDPNLLAEGGMCKVAVRSTFDPGTVTITATSDGLATATATFKTLPLSAGHTTTSVTIRPGLHSALLLTKINAFGNSIRYYISGAADVSLEIVGANGRMVKKVPAHSSLSGWHSIDNKDRPLGAGVYFVRLFANGIAYPTRKVALAR